MNSSAQRVLVVGGVIAIAIVLFFVFKGGGEPESGSSPATTTPDQGVSSPLVIELKGGKPVGGTKTLRYVKGDQVKFTVIPDGSEEEIHVHGYDIAKEADGTKPLEFSFEANLEGSYEIEAHSMSGSHSLVATLEVRPD